jgi:hypothetical protein
MPELTHGEGGGNEIQAQNMVRIGMGEDEIVNPSNLFLPQERGDHILADIEAAFGKSPSVDQHPFPLRKLDKNGVSLSYIQKGHCEMFLEAIPHVPESDVPDEKKA